MQLTMKSNFISSIDGIEKRAMYNNSCIIMIGNNTVEIIQ